MQVPECRHCHNQFEADELVRHQHEEGLLMVHCPECKFILGIYNEHSESPHIDRRRDHQ